MITDYNTFLELNRFKKVKIARFPNDKKIYQYKFNIKKYVLHMRESFKIMGRFEDDHPVGKEYVLSIVSLILTIMIETNHYTTVTELLNAVFQFIGEGIISEFDYADNDTVKEAFKATYSNSILSFAAAREQLKKFPSTDAYEIFEEVRLSHNSKYLELKRRLEL